MIATWRNKWLRRGVGIPFLILLVATWFVLVPLADLFDKTWAWAAREWRKEHWSEAFREIWRGPTNG